MSPDTSFPTQPEAADVRRLSLIGNPDFEIWNAIRASLLRLLPVWFLVSAISAIAAEAKDQPGLLTQEFIFEHGPAPTNHSSTIVETKSGLLAGWFGGPEARHPSNTIFTARYEGRKWSTPTQVADGIQADGKTRYQCWNPVLFQPTRGPLLMFYKVGPSPEAWWGMMMTSTNNGRTWSKPTRLPDGFIGPVRNKPVELTDGSLLCGASTEDNGWAVHMERCFDLGGRWEKTAPLGSHDSLQAIQPTILAHDSQWLQALCRTKHGFVAQIVSSNAGRNWGDINRTDIPNPNSAIDAVRLQDGRFLLIYNHSSSNRCEFSVALSKDGYHWNSGSIPEAEPGEFAYPAVIQSRDGLVHVTYSFNKQHIRHVVLDPAKLVFSRYISPLK